METKKETPKAVRPTVVFSSTEHSVTLKEFQSDFHSVDNAIIICGFPSVTLTPILTAGYLVDQLKLPLIGMMSSPTFPTKITIENGLPLHPIRIYGNNRVVVFMGEFKFATTEITADVAHLILDFARRHKARAVLTCEGLPKEEYHEENPEMAKLSFVATSDHLTTEMEKLGHTPVKEGVISGISGILLAESFWNYDIESGCLIAPTSNKYPSANGAVTITHSLKQIYGFEINLKPLQEKATTIESSFQSLEREEIKASRRVSNSMYG